MKLSLYSHKEMNFVELNITGTEEDFNKCDQESRFMDAAVFNLFTESFEKSNNLYECYGATKFNSRYIVPLRNRLLINLTVLQEIQSPADFQNHINSKVQGKKFLFSLVAHDKNWTDHWDLYLGKLIKINREMLEIVDYCIDEDRILWVIGY